MNRLNLTFVFFILVGCATNEVKKEMTISEKMNFISHVATNPKRSESTKYDEAGCVIKPEGYTFDEIIFDERKKIFYLPNGVVISQIEALALIPGISICDN